MTGIQPGLVWIWVSSGGGLNADFGAPSAVVVHVQDLSVRSECTLDYHRTPSPAANTICIMHIGLFLGSKNTAILILCYSVFLLRLIVHLNWYIYAESNLNENTYGIMYDSCFVKEWRWSDGLMPTTVINLAPLECNTPTWKSLIASIIGSMVRVYIILL